MKLLHIPISSVNLLSYFGRKMFKKLLKIVRKENRTSFSRLGLQNVFKNCEILVNRI